MTGMKSPLQSTLLSPTSSKLMSQYIVKTNLNHHYNKLQNVKARIDNSLPDSILKSQKVRDRQRQGSRPHSSKSSHRIKSANSSRAQSQLSDYENLEEHWMGKPSNDLEAQVEQIVQMTLNGRSKDLQQRFLHQYGPQENEKQLNATYEDTLRTTSRSGQTSALSSYTARSYPSNSEKTGSSIRPRSSISRREDQDLLQTRAHVFTEPEKPFVPKILKSNRTSLLYQYKYYNSAKNSRPKPLHGEIEETGKGEAPPVPKPRQKAFPSNSTHVPLPSSPNVGEESTKIVPPLDIPVDDDTSDVYSSVSPKKLMSSVSAMRESAKLKQSQSAMDLLQDSLSGNKSLSFNLQNSVSMEELKQCLSNRTTPRVVLRKKHNGLNSERSARSTFESKWEETDSTNFMKEVTEEILMKGFYTNRSIQRVFDAHMRKRKGQLSQAEMRKMLEKLQKDLGIPKNSESQETKMPVLQATSVTSETTKPVCFLNSQTKDDYEMDSPSTEMLQEYEKKLTQDEITADTPEDQQVKDVKCFSVTAEDEKVLSSEGTISKQDPDQNVSGNEILQVGADSKVVSESQGTGIRKPVPRPRRRSSTANLSTCSLTANTVPVSNDAKEGTSSEGEKGTLGEKSDEIASPGSEISPSFPSKTAEEPNDISVEPPQIQEDKSSLGADSISAGNSKGNLKPKSPASPKPNEDISYADDFECDEDISDDSDF